MTPSPLLEEIRQAGLEKLTGRLSIRVDDLRIGQILFVDGRIAWATSRDQPVRLGTHLWRLGHVTRSQLDIVQGIYEANRGAKQIGTILEECGFMARSVMRRCLLLHTRDAVFALLACRGARVARENGGLQSDPELLFEIEEVIPPDPVPGSELTGLAESGEGDWATRFPVCEALEPLAALGSYRCGTVVAAEGNVLGVHGDTNAFDPATHGVFLATIMENAARAASHNRLGTLESGIVGCTGGWLVMQWDVTDRTFLVAALTGKMLSVDVVLHVLRRTIPGVRSWIANSSQASYFKDLVSSADSRDQQIEALQTALQARLRQLRSEQRADSEVTLVEEALDLLAAGSTQEALALFARDPGAGLQTLDPHLSRLRRG